MLVATSDVAIGDDLPEKAEEGTALFGYGVARPCRAFGRVEGKEGPSFRGLVRPLSNR